MGERRSTAPAIKSRVKIRPSMAHSLWALCLLAVGADLRAAPVPAAVTIVGQRVALDEAKGELTVEVTVQNHLEVGLVSVEVGWLLAANAEALIAVADPGALYLPADDPKHAKAAADVVVLRRVVDVAVKAQASAPASFKVPLVGPMPQIYRTHVLGYALADASLPLLLRLLNGSAAADERAAVDFFALAGTPDERQAARARLDAARWLNELEPRLIAAVPQRPSATDLHERLFVLRAVGVVGGERAEQALTSLRDRGDIAAFDELLRVVLIDRLRGTRLETPLAFAVPPKAKSFREVVEVALEDARRPTSDGRSPIADDRLPTSDGRSPIADDRLPTSDGRSPIADVRLPTSDGRSPIADVRSPTPDAFPPPSARPFDLREQLLGLAVVVAAAVITLWLLRRNK